MQNNKRYWLKGGIITLIIMFIVLVVVSLLPVYCVGLNADGTGCTSPQGFDAFLYNINFIIQYSARITTVFILPTIILGCIIGGIYGKFKK